MLARRTLVLSLAAILTTAYAPTTFARGGGGGGRGAGGARGGFGGGYGGAGRVGGYGAAGARSLGAPGFDGRGAAAARTDGDFYGRHGDLNAAGVNRGDLRGDLNRADWNRYDRYGWGNSFFFGAGSPFGAWAYPGLGYGLGYAAGSYYGDDPAYTGAVEDGSGDGAYGQTYQPNQDTQAPPDGPANPQQDAAKYAGMGEQAFKAGQYEEAVKAWQHALIEAPNNGALILMSAQAYFAIGKYDEAAAALRHGMQIVPEDKWGVVVQNYTELYRSNNDYTSQLRALEASVEKDATPAELFLLGFHYGYLGHPKEAVRALDKELKVSPSDTYGQMLRGVFTAQMTPAAAPAPATPSATKVSKS